MRRLLRNPRFVVALLAIAAAFAALRIVEPFGTTTPAAFAIRAETDSETDEAAPPNAPLTPASTALGGLERWTPSAALRDPFAAPAPVVETHTPAPAISSAPAPEPRAVLVAATWKQGDRHFALVDGRICQPGDRVGHVKIESIERAAVWLVHPGGRSRVEVGNEILVAPPPAPNASPLAS